MWLQVDLEWSTNSFTYLLLLLCLGNFFFPHFFHIRETAIADFLQNRNSNYSMFCHFTAKMPNFCQANPSSIKPDPDNCARYFNCSQQNTSLGSYKMECSYPDLFSPATLKCQQFDTVACAARKEPKAPCTSCSLISCIMYKGFRQSSKHHGFYPQAHWVFVARNSLQYLFAEWKMSVTCKEQVANGYSTQGHEVESRQGNTCVTEIPLKQWWTPKWRNAKKKLIRV